MGTINNKKGNEGFMISGWTCGIHNGKAFRGLDRVLEPTGKNGPAISLMVHHVRVMSCGKIQMTLLSLEGANEMKGQHYSPDTPIFKDRGDAIAQAEQMLAECAEGCKQECPAYFEERFGTTPDCLNKQGRANFAARKETARQNLELVLSGGLTSRVFMYSDADKFD